MSRHRNYVFTFNNYRDEQLFAIRSLVDGGRAKFVAFQGEIGDSGTKHLQGVAIFIDAITVTAAVSRIGRGCHVEPMRGTLDQALAYCSKEESRDPTGPEYSQFGAVPNCGQGDRSDWEQLRDLAKDGKTLAEIAETHPGHVIRYGKGITQLSSFYKGKRNQPPRVLWYYGVTGSGKSRLAHETYPDAYVKMGSCKWWDGYDQQGCVIIDDYRRDLCTFTELLRLLDRYPYRVEVKGASIEFNSAVIIITTPKSPSDTWSGRTEEDIAQLLRRITEVRRFEIGPFNPLI